MPDAQSRTLKLPLDQRLPARSAERVGRPGDAADSGGKRRRSELSFSKL